MNFHNSGKVEAKVKGYVYVFLIAFFLSATGGAFGEENMQSATPDISAIEVLDLQTAQSIALATNPGMNAAVERV